MIYCLTATVFGLLVMSYAAVTPVVLAVYHHKIGWSEDGGLNDGLLHSILLVSAGRGYRVVR